MSSAVVVGIPESGKSSFIAALSHLLEFKEVDTALTLSRLPDEAPYLFEMREEWHACRPFERTKAGLHPVVFNLIDGRGHRTDLAFPDIAGEEFEQQWSSRVWNEAYVRLIQDAVGVLLFVNAKTLRKPFSLADVARVREAAMFDVAEVVEVLDEVDQPKDAAIDSGEALAKMVAAQGNDTNGETINPAKWNPRQADEQTKLVDILQSLADFDPTRRWRLGIIVSAWDLAVKADPNAHPRRWLDRSMPLLRQYLAGNLSSFDFQVFGVSAQGGDPSSETDRLQRFTTQSERVLVVSDDYRGHDLTRVIVWVTDHNV